VSEHTRGILITLAGVLAIVPDSLLIRLIDAPHVTVVFWRAALAAAVMLAAVAVYYRGATPRVLLGLGGKGLCYAVLMSIATTFFVLAVQLTTVANALFIVSISPVFSALISRFFLGERLSRRMVWTIALAILGVGVIARGSLSVGGSVLAGDLCALGTALALASAFTVARAARRISMVPAVGVAYLITALATLPFADPGTMQGADWGYAILLGCVFVPVGTSLMATGPRYIPSAEVTLLLLLEAILAPLLVWAVLGEFPGRDALVGGAIVIGVLAISNAIALRRSARRIPA